MKFFIAFMMLSLSLIADIQELTSQLYYSKVDELYYVAEKIGDNEQFATWQLMVHFNQGDWASEIKTRFSHKSALASGTIDAAGSLLAPLCRWSDMEAWVIYVTTREPKMSGFSVPGAIRAYKGLINGDISSGFDTTNDYEIFWKKFNDKSSQIEMAVGLATNEDAPFQNHQGIFRNLKYILEGKKEHPGISISLHRFAAKWSLKVLKNKKYALVAPMPSMEHILRSKLNKDDYYVGRNNKVIQISGTVSSGVYQQNCPRYQLSPDFQFKLFGKQGELLIFLTNSSLENSYSWALSKLYLSESYPLFTIDLEELAK